MSALWKINELFLYHHSINPRLQLVVISHFKRIHIDRFWLFFQKTISFYLTIKKFIKN